MDKWIVYYTAQRKANKRALLKTIIESLLFAVALFASIWFLLAIGQVTGF